MTKITLDSSSFKALASETRISILKTLKQRRHTQAEIAAALKITPPTAQEHLRALANAGLVEQIDEGRKWKYYELTRKGKAVLNPEETPIIIVLSALGFAIVGGVVARMLEHGKIQTLQAAQSVGAEAMDVAAQKTALAAPAAIPMVTASSTLTAGWVAFLAITLLLIVVLVVLAARKLKQ